jgi:hypothetical protein
MYAAYNVLSVETKISTSLLLVYRVGRSLARSVGRSNAEVVFSNPTEGMNFCEHSFCVL